MADFVQFLTIPGGTVPDAWDSPILAPNGMIYAVPAQTSTSMLKIDPTTNPPTVSLIPLTVPAGEKWRKAVLAPNGYIYAPRRSGAGNSWLKFDPATETATYIAGTTMTVDGITLVGNVIYGFNNLTSTSPIAVRLDTAGPDTHSTVAAGTYAGTAWGGDQNATGTFFYQVPGSATVVGKFNTATQARTTFGALAAGTDKWVGGVRASNGQIYCAPYGAASTGVLKIDPDTDTTSFLFAGLLSGATLYQHPFIGPDGKVWMLPAGGVNSQNILRVDPATDTRDTIVLGTVARNFRAGIAYGANQAFAVPNDGSVGVLWIRSVPDATDTLLWTLCTESPTDNWQNTGVGGNAFDFLETDYGDPTPGYTLCDEDEFGVCQMLKFSVGARISMDQTQADVNPYDEPWCFEMFFRISNAEDGKAVYMVGDGFGFDGGVWFECTGSGPDKLYVERGLEGTGSSPLVQLIADVPRESRGCVHHMAWRCDPGAPRTELWLNGAFADGGDYTYSDWFSGGSTLPSTVGYGDIEEAGDGALNPELSHIRWSAGYVSDATIKARGYSVRGCCPGFNTPCVPIVNVLV